TSTTHLSTLSLHDALPICATFEPGWKWSESVKPIAGTDSCQVAHTGYQLSGRMVVRMDDGSEHEFRPGDAGIIPPGHDAWVVGRSEEHTSELQSRSDLVCR